MRFLKEEELTVQKKYFKFVGLKVDEFLNWDYQIEHVSNKIAIAQFLL